MHIEHHYNWRYQDNLGKWRTTRHLCSEEMIKKEHPEATPVEGTLTVIEVADTLDEYWERTHKNTISGVMRKPYCDDDR